VKSPSRAMHDTHGSPLILVSMMAFSRSTDRRS